MRIGFDIDGVLADFITAFNDLIHLNYPDKNIPSYDRASFPLKWGWQSEYLSTEENKYLWDIIVHSYTFWGSIIPYSWSYDVFGNIYNNKHDLYFITNRSGYRVKSQTERWLMRRIGIDNPTVNLVPHWYQKHLIVNGLALDVMIEDRPECIQHMAKKCKKTQIICFRQPWNTEIVSMNNIQVVENLIDYCETL